MITLTVPNKFTPSVSENILELSRKVAAHQAKARVVLRATRVKRIGVGTSMRFNSARVRDHFLKFVFQYIDDGRFGGKAKIVVGCSPDVGVVIEYGVDFDFSHGDRRLRER